MKKFTFLLLSLLFLNSVAQVPGVTTYTSVYGANGGQRQPYSQPLSGDIYTYDFSQMSIVRFSGGAFSVLPGSFGSIVPPNIFAAGNAVWLYNSAGDFSQYSNGVYTDHSASVVALIGVISATNPINYAGQQGSNVLFGTRKGILKYDGANFTLINKTNSNLVCDTVNCIVENGGTVYVGTDKGLFTFNGVSFSSIIPFTGAPNQKVDRIFARGANVCVTRTDNTSTFNYYRLSGGQLQRMAAYGDSLKFPVSGVKYMAFVNNNPVFNATNLFTGNYCRQYAAANTFTSYAASALYNAYHAFSHPLNPQKFYLVNDNTFKVHEIDIDTYGNYDFTNHPEAFKFLDTNNVRALIGINSLKHWDLESSSAYEVPKGTGRSANFASNLWIGGLDNSGQLHLAGETYRQTGADFWPGPLDTTNFTANYLTGSQFNKVWKISCNQINQFAANANAGNYNANTAPVFKDINTYIANGNNTNNFAKQLAPFFDANNNGIYEPALGEYPRIKGHQQIYSVYNDKYAPHTETGGIPLGVEVHERSYSYHLPDLPDTMQVINYTTFYNFQVINRSNHNYNNVFITIWSDSEIGYYGDDYIGTDTLNEFGYSYNGDPNDEPVGGMFTYGNKLPMMAYALMPLPGGQNDGVDNNNNGQIDEPNERFKLNLTTYYNNNYGAFPPQTTNPTTALHFYNYMSGYWKDGSPFKPVGAAYNPTLNIPPTKYVFTGNPQTNAGWTGSTASVTPGDTRILCTIGPFNFPANKKVEFEYAYIFSRDTTVNNVNNNLSLLQRDVRNVKYFAAQQLNPSCAPVVTVGINENILSPMSIWVYPNPASAELVVNLDHNAGDASVKLYDITGRLLITEGLRNSYTTRLNLQSIPSGVYVLEIKEGQNKAVKKIIKN